VDDINTNGDAAIEGKTVMVEAANLVVSHN